MVFAANPLVTRQRVTRKGSQSPHWGTFRQCILSPRRGRDQECRTNAGRTTKKEMRHPFGDAQVCRRCLIWYQRGDRRRQSSCRARPHVRRPSAPHLGWTARSGTASHRPGRAERHAGDREDAAGQAPKRTTTDRRRDPPLRRFPGCQHGDRVTGRPPWLPRRRTGRDPTPPTDPSHAGVR